MSESPMKWMERGEINYDPTYHTPTTTTTSETDDAQLGVDTPPPQPMILVPNPFVVEEHFERAILGMEDRIRESKLEGEAPYDPDDRSHPEPTPVNDILLPGLHLGYANAKVTHTKRECLRNRLFAVLLTKLSYNYERRKHRKHDDDDSDSDDPYFVVRLNERDCRFPDEFVEALCDSGHSIEVCPRSTITTFGLAACVKEPDGSWTNIPMAFFFRTGYESSRQRPAYFHPLHGGLDLKIEGPLVGIDDATGTSRKCDVQFYMAIDGLCGWQSNHNPDVPWVERVATCPLYTKEESLAAVRMAGILGCTFNQIGTEMDLPFGGYGVLGVCNDTAALIDAAVRGSTNMYPLLSTGRFLMHIAKFLTKFHDQIVAADQHCTDETDDDENDTNCKTRQVARDTLRLVDAACNAESDIHCAPSGMVGAERRYQSNFPTPYFQITGDSKRVMTEIAEQYKDLEKQFRGKCVR